MRLVPPLKKTDPVVLWWTVPLRILTQINIEDICVYSFTCSFHLEFNIWENKSWRNEKWCRLIAAVLIIQSSADFSSSWSETVPGGVNRIHQSLFVVPIRISVAITLILNRTKHILLIIKGLVYNTENLRQGSLFVLNPAHFVTMEWNYITTKRWNIFLNLCRENKTKAALKFFHL